ncbi:MAG: hypothetical protein ACXACX_04300 [Candidatus Hodarchaeales archaeon]|jgi:hypothetical protein
MRKKLRLPLILVLIISVFISYLLLLPPFIVGINLKDVGAIDTIKTIDAKNLPPEIRSHLTEREYNILLFTPIRDKKTFAVILLNEKSFEKNNIIEITEKQLDWNVNWRNYPAIDQRFHKLVIGEVEELGGLESKIVRLFNEKNGDMIFMISGLNFFIGGLLVTFLFSLLIKRGAWMITTIVFFYSFEFSFFFFESMLHPVVGKPSSSTPTYLFIGFLALFFISGLATIILLIARNDPQYQKKVEKLYESFKIGLKSMLS